MIHRTGPFSCNTRITDTTAT